MPNYKTMMDLPYLGAYSLEDIKEHELTLTIRLIYKEEVTGEGGLKTSRPVIYFAEPGVKPMVLNATNAKTIATLAGSNNTDKWKGLRIIVYATKTKFGKEMVDCLRIRPFLAKPPAQPKVEPAKCADCGKEITEYTAPSGKVFTVDQIVQTGMKKFKRALCMDCVNNLASAQPAEPGNEGGVDDAAGEKTGETV